MQKHPTGARMSASDAGGLAEAVAHLRAGRLVAFPTETVYGLGADALKDAAVAAVFAAKGRPRFNPLICHVPDLPAAERLVTFDGRARALAESFWPGPLTLVLPRRAESGVSLLAAAGLDTLAVRVPAHPVAQELLKAVGLPLVAPSANPSGKISPTTAAHAADGLGEKVALILDGGPCAVGVESTVVRPLPEGIAVLRPGGLPAEDLAGVAGPVIAPQAEGPIRSPGATASHYAPSIPLRMNAAEVRPGEALLAFGLNLPDGAEAVRQLSASGDVTEAAAKLFAALHDLDRPGVTGIAVMPVPEEGLGVAINDRLRRAAAGR